MPGPSGPAREARGAGRPEKWIPVLTAVFILLCAAVLISRVFTGPSVETAQSTVFTPEESDKPDERERLDAILGIETTKDMPDTGGRLNINTAAAEELQELPGIGPVLAERIVRYRETNGPFADVSHLRDVTGIGDGVYGRIADLICAE